MESKGNNEPSPKAVKRLTWIIPIVLIGVIFLLKNIRNPVTDVLFYIKTSVTGFLIFFKRKMTPINTIGMIQVSRFTILGLGSLFPFDSIQCLLIRLPFLTKHNTGYFC